MRKPAFCICKNKDADQLRGNHAADQRLCFFATRIVQHLYFLNPKFQASSHLLWLYSLVCVGPGRKPRRPVFSQQGSFHLHVLDAFFCCKTNLLEVKGDYSNFLGVGKFRIFTVIMFQEMKEMKKPKKPLSSFLRFMMDRRQTDINNDPEKMKIMNVAVSWTNRKLKCYVTKPLCPAKETSQSVKSD